jgi:hypothetical protein
MNARPQRKEERRKFRQSRLVAAKCLFVGSFVLLAARGLPVHAGVRCGSLAHIASSPADPARYADPVRIEVSMKIERKGGKKVVLDMNPEKFSRVLVPDKNADFIVPVTNLLDTNITVKTITLEDHAGNLALGARYSESLILAPAEELEIPVTVSRCHGKGLARIRIIVSAAFSRRDEVKTVDVSYVCRKTSSSP